MKSPPNTQHSTLNTQHSTLIAVLAALLALLLPSCSSEVEETSDEAVTYTVSTAAELLEWAASARTDNNCILAADIDMTGVEWTPKSFFGTFDGQGHTISNLTVSGSGYTGFIGYLGGSGVVKDLTLTNANITGTDETFYGATGGIAGSVQNSASISGCSFSGTVTGKSYTGGIAGHTSMSASITGCSFSGTVTAEGASYGYAGGIAGYANGSGEITACYSSGEVKSTSSYAGGIAGYDRSEITACYSTADVSGSKAAGGVVGYMYDGDTTACYWSGNGPTSGVGYIYSSSSSSYTDNTTKVESDWSGAMSAMNTALKEGGYSYSYRANSGDDSTSFPLVLD